MYLLRVYTTYGDKKIVYEHSCRDLNNLDEYDSFAINKELSDNFSEEKHDVYMYINFQVDFDKFPKIVLGNVILPNDAFIPVAKNPPEIVRAQLIDKLAEKTF